MQVSQRKMLKGGKFIQGIGCTQTELLLETTDASVASEDGVGLLESPTN